MTANQPSRVLVTGATGYVGGRLYKRLEETGIPVRCMVRRPDELRPRVGKGTEVVYGDVTELDSLKKALDGVDVAYYLVHALAASGDFESEEIKGARNFGRAAKEADVKKIIYLGGLGSEKEEQSAHMRSRHAVGKVLRASGVPTVEFRASVVIGAGSLSFEMIRTLVARLPIMITPRWVSVKAQPISINDVLAYLEEVLTMPASESRVYEIGGAEQLSYLDLMKRYAAIRGVRRIFIKVPVLTPRLSSLWLNLVTPVFARVGRKLIDSISSESVVRDESALRDFSVKPKSAEEAIRQALREEDDSFTETHWSDALSSAHTRMEWGGVRFGSRIVDSRTIHIDADPEFAFAPIQRIGGKRGWYWGAWLWKLRGFLDRCVGGVGMMRGRRHPVDLREGDVLDCWRVERFEPPTRLLLRAEMKVPGRAWLQFEVTEEDDGSCIRQTAMFDPVGWAGIAYWYALYPLHWLVFAGMLRNLGKAAEE